MVSWFPPVFTLNLASDTDEYLSSMLGLLPVLFDIQYLGHEGRYNNTILHTLPDFILWCVYGFHRSISKRHDMGEVQIHTTEDGNIAGVTIDSQCSAQHCAGSNYITAIERDRLLFRDQHEY